MKQLAALLLTLILAVSHVFAARTYPATGRVIDEQGEAVAYATVVLLKDNMQVMGLSTDSEGRFTLKAPAGDYTLLIQFLGYEPLRQQVRVEEELQMGDFRLKSSPTEIEGVTVKAQLIRREADRFVVDVANSAAAIGKDGIELLERAPGIWIDGEKITINGKSGSKVFVNDRELRMEPEQLLVYLRALRAEEIQKIEVVPTTGADHDADASGGIIKITLRKQRENGMQGSISLRSDQGKLAHTYSPGGNISYHAGKLDLNASAWGFLGKQYNISDEHTRYTATDKQLGSHSDMRNDYYSGGATAGAIYELSDRHSLGAEFSYYHGHEDTDNTAATDFMADGVTRTDSRFTGSNPANGYEGMFNYIWKIDTLGSTFKVLGDYLRRSTTVGNDNFSRIAAPAPAPTVDSTYRDHTRSSYEVAALTLALDKKFSERWSLKTGVKYTRNDMRNDALYEYLKEEEWKRNDNQSFRLDYTENIAAAYGVVSANLGRWNAVVGLRGEYTRTKGRGSDVEQNYFSLFPNANFSYALTKDGAYSLIAQYARTIERPRFWTLTPLRTQVSDYTYQIGNPELNPSFKHDVSLTLVLKHKYTLTGGITIQTDEINQTMQPDADDPDRLCIAWVNYDATKNYYLQANLPFQPAKWLQLNINVMYMRRGQRLDQHAPETYQNIVWGTASSTFTLPANFFLDLSYRYQGRMELGNVAVKPMNFLNVTVKKRFGDRFTASFMAYSVLDVTQTVIARGEGFTRTLKMQQRWSKRTYQIGLTYNFKAGKAFKHKQVEAGAAEDKGRL